VNSPDPHQHQQHHDQCELRWRAETDPTRKAAAKALAQYFAACIHRERGNLKGARQLAHKCLPALDEALAAGLTELYGYDLADVTYRARHL
jgi:predicted metal-dependent hydrolase